MKRHPLFHWLLVILAILSATVCLASEGSYASYVYSATGERLRATHCTKLILRFPGGYATIIDGTVTFHYYTQDYLGNNRAVVNGSTGEIEQTVAYYPYGAVIADLGISTLNQPFKFGGKELTTQNGLNEYDFGARQYYPAVPGFTSVDPLCEKTPDLSPYLYCGNNPVNAIDADGKLIIFVNGFHFGDGRTTQYWDGVDQTIMNLMNDHKPIYIDGSMGGIYNLIFSSNKELNFKVQNRIQFGYYVGLEIAELVYKILQGEESIKVVTHSMGAAAAKGIIDALIDYSIMSNQEHKILLELDLAPYQPTQQEGNPEVPTYKISHRHDPIAKYQNMKNAKNYILHDNDNNIFLEHAIKSFNEDIKQLIRDGKIPLYIDGDKQN